ncbi:hypothetical protein KIPB_004150, partial [Kipferlia bialata]
PGYAYKYAFVALTLILGVATHFALMGLFSLYAKRVPYPVLPTVADGDRVYAGYPPCVTCKGEGEGVTVQVVDCEQTQKAEEAEV